MVSGCCFPHTNLDIRFIVPLFAHSIMFRLASRLVTGRSLPKVLPSVKASLYRPSLVQGVRFQSSTGFEEDEKLKEIVEKLRSNPEIAQILQEFQSTIIEKGFDPLRPPSMMEMMRLFAQKEVRELAAKLKTKLDEAGIVLSPEHIGLFMNNFKK